jgi:hypothetical protein
MPFQKDYNDQAKVVKYILAVEKELAKLRKDAQDDDALQLKLIKEKQTELNKLKKIQKDNAKIIKDSLSDFEDMDDSIVSFGNQLKKNTKFVEKQRDVFDTIKVATSSIAMELAAGGTANKKTQAQVIAMNNSYKAMHVSIADINKEYALGRISNAERIQQIKQQSEAFQDVAAKVDMTSVTSEDLTKQIKSMVNEGHSFTEAMEKSEMQSEKLDNIFESFEGIPALREVNTLLKTNIKDTVAFKAAVFALGAALGAAAMDYFGAPMKAAIQAQKEREQNEIDTIADIAKLRKDAEFIPAKIGQERLEHEIEATNQINELMHEAAYAGQKAAIQFSASMQSGAAQFERAAKTALFGNKLGSVGYGAAQLQLAGIGADKIASAMEAASMATGKMPTAKAAADMAVMAERTGQSVDDISTINEAFMRMDGMSADVAMNMQEGMRNMADQAGIGLGNLMKEVAESSKEALGYQIKSGPALAKAVAYTQSMGLNFGDVAKAGKNMVMNYKDSIKAEMQLSSLLGEQVDLSEVRAKFAAGDTEGALGSLKSQGLDPADMDMFQQQALQDALGGMDLSSLSKVANNTGKSGGNLAAGNAKGGNKDFLSRTQQAEASLSAKEASISANTAVVDAKLSKEIADAYLASPEYEKYKKEQAEAAVAARELESSMTDAWKATDAYKKSLSDTAKLNFVDTMKEGLMKGLGAVGGGLLTTGISKMFGKKGGDIAGMITGGGGGGEEGGGDAGAATEGPIASVAAQIEAAAPVLEKSKSLGQNLKDFGKGIGSFLTSVGKGAGGAIQGIMSGIAKGLAAFGSGSVEILLGATTIAGVITIIGAGIAAASWIMGKALPTLAEGLMKFNDIDGGNLAKVGLGITALGAGLAAMGVGSVVAGIGNLVGKLFGGGIEDTIKKVEIFQDAKINAARVKENADAIVNYSKAMAASGLGSAVSGLGNLAGGIANGVAKFFGFKPPLQQMQEFSKLNLGDPIKLKSNAEAFTLFGEAMSSYQGGSGSLSGVIADAAANFFKIEPPLEKMKKFAAADLGDVSKLKGNAEAFTLFGNAMASFKGMNGGLMAVLADGLADFFEIEPPLAKMQRFAAMEGIDVAKTKNNAEAFTAFANAMASYSGTGTGFWKSLGEGFLSLFGAGDGDLIAKFARFAALDSVGMKGSAEAIGIFNRNLAGFDMNVAQNVGKAIEDAGLAIRSGLGTGLGGDTTFGEKEKNPVSLLLDEFTASAIPAIGAASGIDTFANALYNLSSALERLGSVNTKSIDNLPWLKMTAFAAAGGKIVLAQSANNSFNIAQDTAKNIEKLATDTKANVQISKNLQALLAVLADNGSAAFSLNIDGKAVTNMITKREADRKAGAGGPK